MAKDKNGDVVPHDISEKKHEWKCTQCKEKGKAATKKDAQLAKALHVALVHG